jgi:hypothetical protein
MRTIETTAIVTADHTITVKLPDDIPPGECQVILVFNRNESKPHDALTSFRNWPSHNLGPWPEGFTASREQIYGDDGR